MPLQFSTEYAPDALHAFAADVTRATGASEASAGCVAELLVRADLSGHPSHGVRRLPEYVEAWRRGETVPSAAPAIVRDGGSTVAVEGSRSLGQVTASFVAGLASERARAHGVCAVTFVRCGHIGRLGDYVERAADAGLVGFLFVNDSGTGQGVAYPGCVEPRLSTNPLAVAIPRAAPPHFVFDMATSAVAAGKLHVLRDLGRPIPVEWVRDGLIQPAAGHKGFGLALVVEALAGVLSGAGFVRPDAGPDEHQGGLFVAIDVARFQPLEHFARDLDAMLAWATSAPAGPGRPGAQVPGEATARARAASEAAGVAVPQRTVELLDEVAAGLGVASLSGRAA